MKRPTILFAIALIASACTARPMAFTPTAPPPTLAPTPTAPLPTVALTPTALPPTLEPTATPTAAPTIGVLLPTAGANAPASVASFADLPGNLAKGEPAPDFTARMMGGGTFRLSQQRGSFVLLLPTAVGCGECLFTLREVATAYPDYRGRGVNVVILNLYADDTPETWEAFAEVFAEPEFMWGVVSSPDFVVAYDIQTLSTVLLLDRDGRLVFRSESQLQADGFRQLFDLATR
jgi:peroxiredoxin